MSAFALGVAGMLTSAPATFAQPAAAVAPPPAGAPSAEVAPDTLLATVNGQKITQRDVNVATDDLGPNLSQQYTGKARDGYVLGYLIDSTLVAQKAKADKLDQTSDFAVKLALLRDKALTESLLTTVAKSATDEATLHKIYDDAAKAQKPEPEIRARHILVATEADAQAALKRIKGGEDFGKVAKEVSKDPGSEGGDLGWFTRERMVPEFADAAFKLKDGQISDPVKSQFGWHIIQVEEHRTKTFPPYEQVREQLVRYAVQKAQSDLIFDLPKPPNTQNTAAAPPPPADAAPDDAAPGK